MVLYPAPRMSPRRSPLMLVAVVVFVAALLLAFTLPDHEARFVPCPVGVGVAEAERLGCGPRVDRRVPERFLIAGVGVAVAILLGSVARRYGRDTLDQPPPPA